VCNRIRINCIVEYLDNTREVIFVLNLATEGKTKSAQYITVCLKLALNQLLYVNVQWNNN